MSDFEGNGFNGDSDFDERDEIDGNRIDGPSGNDAGNDSDDDDFDPNARDDGAGDGNRIVGARAKAVAEHLARSIADSPDSIEVDLQEGRGQVSVMIHADPDDIGRLIGRRGRVIQAVRQVVRAAAASEGIRADVDIAD